MSELDRIAPDLGDHVDSAEREWLEAVIAEHRGMPDLEALWRVMDRVWSEMACDPDVMDERIGRYYRHPVWLLNGLFVESHDQSIANREGFARWVEARAPTRVADIGGGFGSLARRIGALLPEATVEIVEPHPSRLGLARAAGAPNVDYVESLTGDYDLLIATDVFEHVPDPLGFAAETASHLRTDGIYLIANCFEPVIACHLPSTFHFRYTWPAAMQALGLAIGEKVLYGQAFMRPGPLDLAAARLVANRSERAWRFGHRLPGALARRLYPILFR